MTDLAIKLRKAADYLRLQHPRPCFDGEFIDQIMKDAALTLWGDSPHPDQTSPMTVGSEAFLEEPQAPGYPNSITTIMEDPPGEPDWSQGDIIYQPRGMAASIGE